MACEKQAALDMLMVKCLVEDQVLRLRWVPTWKQVADPLTKDMSTELLKQFRQTGKLCLVETKEDQVEEARRAKGRGTSSAWFEQSSKETLIFFDVKNA